MEKRLNKRVETYLVNFKNEIKDNINALQVNDITKMSKLVEFVYNYPCLAFEKEDFAKRKRVKNNIPNVNRCVAKRANGEQCTRRRKENCEFCGTHLKGIPHGSMQTDEAADAGARTQSLYVVTEEINGILYYIDTYNNVYNPEDILAGNENPRIIAKAENTNGVYRIPAFVV
jgi:hypothetical protein